MRRAETTMASPGIAAFFDMDYTVLRGSSGLLYVRYLRRTGRVGWLRWAVILSEIALYAMRLRDFPHLMGRVMKQAAGAGEVEAWRLSREWFDAMLRDYIAEEARRRVAQHQAQGHHVALISAATPYAVQPIAEALGLGSSYMATHLEVSHGQFTGRVKEPACFGQGKLVMAADYAADRGIDLSQSYFYTDSFDDLPLLEAVGHPIAVNPDRRLARLAALRGWPVERFY